MAKIKLCEECGVPLAISREHTWHDNGVFAQNRNPDHRLVFYESDNMAALFPGIGHIIGLNIDQIVLESERRETRQYVEGQVSPFQRRLARRVGTKAVISNLSTMGRAFGFGDVGPVGHRRKGKDDDFVTISVRNPHSLLSFCGETLGAWEAIDGRDNTIEHEKVGDRQYHVTCRPGSHPIELQERLKLRTYNSKPGNVGFKRCETCGVPLDVSQYQWNLEEGTITHPDTGMRMCVLGVIAVDTLMEDLEAELGEAVPEAVIEAQRRLIKAAMKGVELRSHPAAFRRMLACRGLGNLTSLETSGGTQLMTIQSSCLALPVVGIIQALYELMAGLESSTRRYELAPDGDLTIELSAK
jgi:hypothetical protein